MSQKERDAAGYRAGLARDILSGMTVTGRPGVTAREGRARAWLVPVPLATALVLATPVAAWWLVGPLNTTPARAELDYAFRPLPIGPVATRAAGIAAATVAVVSLALLIWATAAHRLDVRWWRALTCLVVAGFVVGAGWRVLTAGGIGANFSAGFVIMIGVPLVLILVAWAVGYAIYLGWGQSPPGQEGPAPDLLAWAQVVDVSRVTDHAVKAAEDYLRDAGRMSALAGREYGLRLVSLLETQVTPPPPLSLRPSDVASTVLAVRRKQLGVEDGRS